LFTGQSKTGPRRLFDVVLQFSSHLHQWKTEIQAREDQEENQKEDQIPRSFSRNIGDCLL